MNFKKLVTTTLLTSAILGSGSIASAANLDSKGEIAPLTNTPQMSSIFTTNEKASITASVVYVGGRLEANGSSKDYIDSKVFTLSNNTGTNYKGWQESEKANAAAYLKYELKNASTGTTVSQVSYYGEVKANDGRTWPTLSFTSSNIKVTDSYYVRVTNLGSYPVNFAGNVYN
ncbi:MULTISPECIES: hypothetical protein [Bacillus subtilis group]|uniref:hypothetical protein n=1 Tax=Bacillus subtilis group TaxID=653685 RepID=UPI0029C8AA13|nr:hypothetical protein [Bacillus velezensis]MEC3666974.1 hypothetical protein [Bacillus velezensis]WPF78433.1 hypothetical protein SCZ87_18570 [Bacillus velezensis]